MPRKPKKKTPYVKETPPMPSMTGTENDATAIRERIHRARKQRQPGKFLKTPDYFTEHDRQQLKVEALKKSAPKRRPSFDNWKNPAKRLPNPKPTGKAPDDAIRRLRDEGQRKMREQRAYEQQKAIDDARKWEDSQSGKGRKRYEDTLKPIPILDDIKVKINEPLKPKKRTRYGSKYRR